jgi:hypothetical protein
MKEEYETISCQLLAKTASAIKIDHGGDVVWIPRSLLHGASDREVDNTQPNEYFEVKIMSWKVKQIGWG